MSKIVLRKGIFETSSSSEDSLTVWQEMKLFILPVDEYEKFKNGELYVKLNGVRPFQYTDDEDVVKEDNIKMSANVDVEPFKNHEFIMVNRWCEDFLYYLNNFYTSYETYRYAANRKYTDVEFFEYDNEGEVIFGFYGYLWE